MRTFQHWKCINFDKYLCPIKRQKTYWFCVFIGTSVCILFCKDPKHEHSIGRPIHESFYCIDVMHSTHALFSWIRFYKCSRISLTLICSTFVSTHVYSISSSHTILFFSLFISFICVLEEKVKVKVLKDFVTFWFVNFHL